MSEKILRTFILPLLLLAVFVVPTTIHAQATSRQDKIISSIRTVLEAQRDAWNRGDIEGYMNGYDRSNNTVFISGDSVARGWQTVLDRYRKSYSSREKMGMLTFSDLEITPLTKDVAVVIGSWRLKRTNDELHGKFTLIFRKTKNGWRIIHDHTS